MRKPRKVAIEKARGLGTLSRNGVNKYIGNYDSPVTLAPAKNAIKKPKAKRTTYVVCQTHRCQQTYPMEYFGVITKDTKDIACEKCGGVLVDSNGRANFSQNAAVRPVISIEEYESQKARNLKRKREELADLEEEIKELEDDI